jgi:hypothetical protein
MRHDRGNFPDEEERQREKDKRGETKPNLLGSYF